MLNNLLFKGIDRLSLGINFVMILSVIVIVSNVDMMIIFFI